MSKLRVVRVAHFSAGHAYSESERYGHNFKLEAHFDALNGTVQDHAGLATVVKTVVDTLDHYYLNEAIPFFKTNPATPENIARYAFEEISKRLKDSSLKVFKVRVYEGDRTWADFFRSDASEPERDF